MKPPPGPETQSELPGQSEQWNLSVEPSPWPEAQAERWSLSVEPQLGHETLHQPLGKQAGQSLEPEKSPEPEAQTELSRQTVEPLLEPGGLPELSGRIVVKSPQKPEKLHQPSGGPA